MRLAAMTFCFLFGIAGLTHAQTLRTFTEPRFGTVAAVPADWREVPPRDGWAGRHFVSPDGQAWLAVYGVQVARDRLRAAEGADARASTRPRDEAVSYRTRGRNWLVASGYKGDRIFYRKAIVSCGGRIWHHLAFEYPRERKREFDALVTIASRSLRTAPGAGCG